MATVKKPIKKAQNGIVKDNTSVGTTKNFSKDVSGDKILTAKKNRNYESSLKDKAAQKRKEATSADIASIQYIMNDGNLDRSEIADKIAAKRRNSADSLENVAKKNKIKPKYKPVLKNGGSVKAKDGKWMQKAAASIKKRGTKGVCTGAKFGGPTCKPGSKRYALAKTFKSVAKKKK
jgi:hypothetical protein